jgi:hypothetical protein
MTKNSEIKKRKINLEYELGKGEYAALKVCARRMDKTVHEFLHYLLGIEANLVIQQYREFGEMEMNEGEKIEFYGEHGEPDWTYEIDSSLLPQ